VLAAPPDERIWATCDPQQLRRIVDLLAESYDFVVLDTSGSFDAVVQTCVEASTLTLLVTSGEVSSIRDTAAALRRLSTWEVNQDRLKVVLNRNSSANGFALHDLESGFGRSVFWQVPLDRAVPSSVQVGRPVMLEGTSPAAANVAELARRIVGTRRSLSGEPGRSKTVWGRILNRARGGA